MASKAGQDAFQQAVPDAVYDSHHLAYRGLLGVRRPQQGAQIPQRHELQAQMSQLPGPGPEPSLCTSTSLPFWCTCVLASQPLAHLHCNGQPEYCRS